MGFAPSYPGQQNATKSALFYQIAEASKMIAAAEDLLCLLWTKIHAIQILQFPLSVVC